MLRRCLKGTKWAKIYIYINEYRFGMLNYKWRNILSSIVILLLPHELLYVFGIMNLLRF